MIEDMEKLLTEMFTKGASDLHIGGGSPLMYRIHSDLVPVNNKVLTPEDSKRITYSFLTKEQIEIFEREWELDFSFGLGDVARFRVNVFKQRSSIGAAIRIIPYEKMSFEECGLPVNVITSLCKKQRGLVLVTGATGSGKSTTLASMIDYINKNRPCHIVTVEDPIEFVHRNSRSIVDQREVYSDTHSFGNALKHVLRQDPDVILIGEMRDLETISSALTIAETGHLVFATLHTSDCVQTINRIVDVFPSHQQSQIKLQLSFVLLGVVSQQLLPIADKTSRKLATEVLLATPAVRALVREGKVHQLYSVMQTSQKEGMQTMNQCLANLYIDGFVSYEDSIQYSSSAEEFDKIIGKK
ncbi:MAG: type IV pilus twitching motility protein PilT [Candidatus Omnitrophica bacterium]|nr:type IV pilus twitching motility protein PilT [Candidatus Omnitrophota bacterium]